MRDQSFPAKAPAKRAGGRLGIVQARLWRCCRRLLPLFFLTLSTGCAARSAPPFRPAAGEETEQALRAWEKALERAESLEAARLLYDASLKRGLARVPGTLAVILAPGELVATLTGPFGSAIARYGNGALSAEGGEAVQVEPDELRSLLAGAWRGGAPQVAGTYAGEALLRWGEDGGGVEAVLDLREARLRSLRIHRPEGEVLVAYSGRFDPWPEKVEIVDLRSGRGLRLTLIAREGVGPAR